jgi:hypothetical protein
MPNFAEQPGSPGCSFFIIGYLWLNRMLFQDSTLIGAPKCTQTRDNDEEGKALD